MDPRILIADDEAVSRAILHAALASVGYRVVVAADGNSAWQILNGPNPPELAVLDWTMPDPDGIELCRRFRAAGPAAPPVYLILLTANDESKDIVAGLNAGADDYICKPFDPEELRARVRTGLRVVALQRALADRVRELEAALSKVKQLQRLLPICSYCKKIRDDRNYWDQVDNYISRHADVQFSHGICPDCYTNIVDPQLERESA